MNLFRNHVSFLLPYSIALVLGLFALFSFEKGELLLWINHNHKPLLDVLFYYGTYLGNGLIYLLIIFIFGFRNLGMAFIGFISFLQTSVFVTILKRLIFSDMQRPKAYFDGVVDLYFVQGVEVWSQYSFPSGHTAAAFSLFCFLTLAIPNKKLGLLFILCALIGGISRIYLVQHFFMDVYVGSIIGVIISVVNFYWITNSQWFSRQSWKSKGLFQ